MNYQALNSIILNFVKLRILFEESAFTESKEEMKTRLYGLVYQMKQFSFLFGLSLAIEILSITDLLATQLQDKTLSAYDGKKLAEKCIITLKAMTLEFDSFWDKIVTKANELEVENTKLPRKVVKPLRFRDFADDTTENAPTTKKSSLKISTMKPLEM